jgi:hypothetical protein
MNVGEGWGEGGMLVSHGQPNMPINTAGTKEEKRIQAEGWKTNVNVGGLWP